MIKYPLLVTLLFTCACGSHGATQSKAAGATADPLRRTSAAELYLHGKQLAAHGDYVRAEQYITAAIAQGYPRAQALPLLMKACIAASHLYTALKYALPFLEQHPSEWRLRLLVAQIFTAVQEYQRAKQQFEQVIIDAPNQALAHYSLAVLLRDHFQATDKAVEYFERYLLIDPEGAHAEEARSAAILLRANPQVKMKASS